MTDLEQFIEDGCVLSYYSIEDGTSQLIVDFVPLHNVAVDFPGQRLLYGEAFDFGRTGTTHLVHYDTLRKGIVWIELLKDGLRVAHLEKVTAEYFTEEWRTYKSTYADDREHSRNVLMQMLSH